MTISSFCKFYPVDQASPDLKANAKLVITVLVNHVSIPAIVE